MLKEMDIEKLIDQKLQEKVSFVHPDTVGMTDVNNMLNYKISFNDFQKDIVKPLNLKYNAKGSSRSVSNYSDDSKGIMVPEPFDPDDKTVRVYFKTPDSIDYFCKKLGIKLKTSKLTGKVRFIKSEPYDDPIRYISGSAEIKHYKYSNPAEMSKFITMLYKAIDSDIFVDGKKVTNLKSVNSSTGLFSIPNAKSNNYPGKIVDKFFKEYRLI